MREEKIDNGNVSLECVVLRVILKRKQFSTKERRPNLCQGGEDLIGGHGLKRVFFPHRTWQVLNVVNTFAPIAFLKCGLQLQGSRGGVNPTKWTQVQITRVASPEK